MKIHLKKKILILIVLIINTQTFSWAGSYISWDSSSGVVKGYKIYYSKVAGNYSESNSQDVGLVNRYPISNLPLNDSTLYYFVIRAYNTYGESQNSDMISWETKDNTPPLPPDGVTVQ